MKNKNLFYLVLGLLGVFSSVSCMEIPPHIKKQLSKKQIQKPGFLSSCLCCFGMQKKPVEVTPEIQISKHPEYKTRGNGFIAPDVEFEVTISSPESLNSKICEKFDDDSWVRPKEEVIRYNLQGWENLRRKTELIFAKLDPKTMDRVNIDSIDMSCIKWPKEYRLLGRAVYGSKDFAEKLDQALSSSKLPVEFLENPYASCSLFTQEKGFCTNLPDNNENLIRVFYILAVKPQAILSASYLDQNSYTLKKGGKPLMKKLIRDKIRYRNDQEETLEKLFTEKETVVFSNYFSIDKKSNCFPNEKKDSPDGLISSALRLHPNAVASPISKCPYNEIIVLGNKYVEKPVKLVALAIPESFLEDKNITNPNKEEKETWVKLKEICKKHNVPFLILPEKNKA